MATYENRSGSLDRGCNIPACACSLLLLLVWASAAAAQPAGSTKTYRDERRAIQFSYPSGWTVAKCRRLVDCVAIWEVQANMDNTDYDGDLKLDFVDFDPEYAITFAGFEKRDGRWFLEDFGGNPPAQEISGRGWKGLKSVGTCPFGRQLTAVLTSGNRSVTVRTECFPSELIATAEAVVKSFVFGPVAPDR
jgi:hypothetical protein